VQKEINPILPLSKRELIEIDQWYRENETSAFDCGGNADILEDIEHAIIFEDDDIRILTHALPLRSYIQCVIRAERKNEYKKEGK